MTSPDKIKASKQTQRIDFHKDFLDQHIFYYMDVFPINNSLTHEVPCIGQYRFSFAIREKSDVYTESA